MSSVEENEHLLTPEVAVDVITEQQDEKEEEPNLQRKSYLKKNEHSHESLCLLTNFSLNDVSKGKLYPDDELKTDINKCKSLDNIIAISSSSSSTASTSKSTNCLPVSTYSDKQTCSNDNHDLPTNELLETDAKKIKKQPRRNTCHSKKTFNNILTNTNNVSRSTPVLSYSCDERLPLCHTEEETNTISTNENVQNIIPQTSYPHHLVYQQRSYETSQSSESVICRICHSSGDDRLIAPCRCDGSTRYVHATCLVTWFKKSVKNQCELCKSDVKIRKINHRFSLWRKPEDRPIPIIWFSVFLIGLFLNILSIYVNASESCASTACLIFYVVNGFGIILDAAFLWFWFLKCKHYWKKWCALNQDWFIDDLEDETSGLAVEYVRSLDEAFV